MFSVGSAVVYASYGVCVIDSIEKKDFSGENIEYYVLQPAGDARSRFYVPVGNSSLTEKMRPVMSRSEVEELISVMPDEDTISTEDEAQSREIYRGIIDSGDRHKLVALIKTLYLRRKKLEPQHRKLRSADEKFLADAENMLYDEFAYALGIPRSEVLPYIMQAIGQ